MTTAATASLHYALRPAGGRQVWVMSVWLRPGDLASYQLVWISIARDWLRTQASFAEIDHAAIEAARSGQKQIYLPTEPVE